MQFSDLIFKHTDSRTHMLLLSMTLIHGHVAPVSIVRSQSTLSQPTCECKLSVTPSLPGAVGIKLAITWAQHQGDAEVAVTPRPWCLRGPLCQLPRQQYYEWHMVPVTDLALRPRISSMLCNTRSRLFCHAQNDFIKRIMIPDLQLSLVTSGV